MRITCGNIVLAAGGVDSPEDLNREWEDELDIYQPTGGEAPEIENLGGRTMRVRFQITREHADFAAAEHFWNTHDHELPRKADVTITTEGGGGTLTDTVLKKATVHAGAARLVGRATIHTYTITGAIAAPLLPAGQSA